MIYSARSRPRREVSNNLVCADLPGPRREKEEEMTPALTQREGTWDDEGLPSRSSLSPLRHLCAPLFGRHPDKRFRSCTFSVTTTRHRNASHTRHNGPESVKLGGAGQLHGRLGLPSSGSWLSAELTTAVPKHRRRSDLRRGAPKPGVPVPLLPPSGYRVALYNAIIQISSQSKSVSRCYAPQPRIAARRSIIVLDLSPAIMRSASLSSSSSLSSPPFSTESRCKVTRSELYHYGVLCNSRSLPLFIPRINVHGGYTRCSV